jgi:RNA polymerase sigma-70 factor (ECF subfamily)
VREDRGRALVAVLGDAARAAGASSETAEARFGGADLPGRLIALVDAARAALPDVKLADEAFVAFVAARLPDAEPPEAALARLAPHVRDLLLAAATLAGDPRAVRRFDEEELAKIPGYLRSMGGDATFAADVAQIVRERLLLGAPRAEDDAPRPRLAEYEGRGPLGGLVRVMAIRAALDLRRRPGPTPIADAASDDAAIELASPSADPETEYLKRHHTQAFREAFTRALAALDAEDRMLLRLHHLDGLSIDELGTLHKMHRSTVARRLARGRQRVLEATHAELARALGLRPEDLASFMDAVRSRFHLSLGQFSKKADGA